MKKFFRILFRTVGSLIRLVLWTVMGVLLFAIALIVVIYSPPTQKRLVDSALEMLNRKGSTQFEIGDFSLKFPLRVSASNVAMIDSLSSDTLMKAAALDVKVNPFPLLIGDIAIVKADLHDAFYRIGGPDSSMYLRLTAKDIDLSRGKVSLGKGIDIDLEHGQLDGGRVNIFMNPDPTKPPSDSTAVIDIGIKVKELQLRDFIYSMEMMPTIDSLIARIDSAGIENADINLRNQLIEVGSFQGKKLNAVYTAPNNKEIAQTVISPYDSIPSTAEPWVVKVNKIGFTQSQALYTTSGYVPEPGLDFGYIQVNDMDLEVDNFYNRQTTVVIPVTKVTGIERSGVELTANGTVKVDSVSLSLVDLDVTTPVTDLKAQMRMGMGDMLTDPTLPIALDVKGYLGIPDIKLMFPFTKPMLSGFTPTQKLDLAVDLDGTMGDIDLRELDLGLNHTISLRASGNIENALDIDNISGNIALKGHIQQSKTITNLLSALALGPGYAIPTMNLNGKVDMHKGLIKGDLKAMTQGGVLALNAAWQRRTEGYNVKLKAKQFPVNAFMPELGVGHVTADLTIKGHGYNPLSPKMAVDAQINLGSLVYEGYDYTGIEGTASLHDGKALVDLHSSNEDTDFDIKVDGNISKDTYTVSADIDVPKLDLFSLHLVDEPMSVTTAMHINGSYTPEEELLAATLKLKNLNLKMGQSDYVVDNLTARLNSNDSVSNLSIQNRDMYGFMSVRGSLDSISTCMANLQDSLAYLKEIKRLNVVPIQKALPEFNLDINAGSNNFLSDILSQSDMGFSHMQFQASNDSLIKLDGRVIRFYTGDTRLDTIDIKGWQRDSMMLLQANVNNRPGTFDDFAHITVHSYFTDRRIGLFLKQTNIKDKVGFMLGLKLQSEADSTLVLSFTPTRARIGYKDWTINDSNYISYNVPSKRIQANLRMRGEGSSLSLYTLNNQPQARGVVAEDVILQIDSVYIQDWLTLNPFAPPITGEVNAKMKINYLDGVLNGDGVFSLHDLFYNKERVGNFDADVTLETRKGGLLRAKADLFVDSVKTITVAGNLNDTTAMSPFNMDFNMIHMPLAVANPFLPANTAKLRGTLNGTLQITGDQAAPLFNGYLDFDSAAVTVDMLGATYPISDEKISMVNNVVQFKNFAISGVNDVPLTLNGTVEIADMTIGNLDLALKTRNMQLVNSSRAAKGASVYGKAFIDMDASLNGNLRYMDLQGSLSLLPSTNVTYVVSTLASELTEEDDKDMVKFVVFNDTLNVAKVDSLATSTMVMNVDAILNIQQGNTITVDLGGTNKVQVQTSGVMNFTMAPPSTDPRLTGRLNINNGFVRYSNMIISEKLFNFEDGSYVAFNGDMMDPTLNVKAVDKLKANVTDNGQNARLVNFDVSVAATGTLERLDVVFDLSTDDDLTVANELSSMSAEQRANQAMNLLLYGMYTGPNTQTSVGNGTSYLYSFMASQLNTWAANNIKGVDLSFGVDQYNQTQNGRTSNTMSYSYQVSKSLFDDRFKIVVGGNYTTDANADENFSENLISDISFEYLLNRSGSMYVRLFRHTGFESILEGEITQTGVGFVYKKNIRTIGQMFRFLRPKRKKKETAPEAAQTPVENENIPRLDVIHQLPPEDGSIQKIEMPSSEAASLVGTGNHSEEDQKNGSNQEPVQDKTEAVIRESQY